MAPHLGRLDLSKQPIFFTLFRRPYHLTALQVDMSIPHFHSVQMVQSVIFYILFNTDSIGEMGRTHVGLNQDALHIPGQLLEHTW